MSYYDCLENEEEIKRHHRDFETISNLLDEFFKHEPSFEAAIKTLKQIRNVVG